MESLGAPIKLWARQTLMARPRSGPAVHLATLARYPFLPEAAAYVESDGPALEDLLSDKVYAGIRTRGRERLLSAVLEASVEARALSTASPQGELLEELLSYVYARILASALADAWVVRRHALAEAVRVRDLLMKERDPDVVAQAARVVGIEMAPHEEGWSAHFTDFLRYAVHLKDLEWKLVSQPMTRGFVQLDAHKASRLAQEGLRRRIESELPRKLSPEIVKLVETDLGPIRAEANARKDAMKADALGAFDVKLLPPCMSHLLAQLQRGENLPHFSRFALTSFLREAGLGTEEIMKLFSSAPDFREDLTRYQVEHITGVTSSTVYNAPNCATMQTFNACVGKDSLCDSRRADGKLVVISPLGYYKRVYRTKGVAGVVCKQLDVLNGDELERALAEFYPLQIAMGKIVAAPAFATLTPKAFLEALPAEQLAVEARLTDGKPALYVNNWWFLANHAARVLNVSLAREDKAPAPEAES